MDLGLTGKSALVLASSQGLGLGIAEAIAAEGASVMLVGRSADKLSAAAEAITGRGAGRAVAQVGDLAEPAFVEMVAGAAEAAFGQVDILVNNSGGPPAGPIAEADPAELARQFEMIVVRFASMAQRLLPGMRARGWGRILTVASSGTIQPIPNLGLSNAVRGSLVGWSKTLATEVAADGVTVNMLLPGRIHTDRVDQLDAGAAKRTGKDIDAVRAAARAAIPAGRYGTPAEFGAVAAFLVSDKASYVTGSQVRCDGGAVRSV
ncbi:MAG: SDR family oxidoreductase [Pseudomonadota bacterium]